MPEVSQVQSITPLDPPASASATVTLAHQPRPQITRDKISLSKTKFTKGYLVSEAVKYVNSIVNAPPEDRKFPTVTGFCLAAGISRPRFYELASVPGDVADILEYIGMLQEEAALSGGMTGKTHPIFSMFLLKSKHGYQDTAPTLHQSNVFNVTPELLADALQIMKSKKTKAIAIEVDK